MVRRLFHRIAYELHEHIIHTLDTPGVTGPEITASIAIDSLEVHDVGLHTREFQALCRACGWDAIVSDFNRAFIVRRVVHLQRIAEYDNERILFLDRPNDPVPRALNVRHRWAPVEGIAREPNYHFIDRTLDRFFGGGIAATPEEYRREQEFRYNEEYRRRVMGVWDIGREDHTGFSLVPPDDGLPEEIVDVDQILAEDEDSQWLMEHAA